MDNLLSKIQQAGANSINPVISVFDVTSQGAHNLMYRGGDAVRAVEVVTALVWASFGVEVRVNGVRINW